MNINDNQVPINHRVIVLLQEDAEKIRTLMKAHLKNTNNRSCPLYEEVFNTQMYGFKQRVDFAARLGIIEKATGKLILLSLERDLSIAIW
ncbi:DUF1507 family protein [Paenibacillus jamilae]|uniref:DUF1507 family protein n=1 Tax=Paenibacillus jamilae TaxID=114136 RepID=UPI003D2CC956